MTNLISMMNSRLADLADYKMQVKQAHWSVRGANFASLHAMFDSMASEADGYADVVAERIIQLGGRVKGTLQAAAKSSSLQDYPTDAEDARDHLMLLRISADKLVEDMEAAIKASDQNSDRVSADVFTDVARGLAKQLWFLEAHLT